jgi:hypothetical protein
MTIALLMHRQHLRLQQRRRHNQKKRTKPTPSINRNSLVPHTMLHQTPTNRLLLSLLVLIARVDGFVPLAGPGRTSTSIYASDYSRSTGQPQQQVRTGETPAHFMSKADDARKVCYIHTCDDHQHRSVVWSIGWSVHPNRPRRR